MTAKSNFFRVKSVAKFRKWASDYDLIVEETFPKKRSNKRVGLKVNGGTGMFPRWEADRKSYLGCELKPVDQINFPEELAEHLKKDEVAILMTCGCADGARFVGSAVAVRSSGETLTVDLDDIYLMIFDQWKLKHTEVD